MTRRRGATRKVTNGKGQRFYAKGSNSKNGEVFRRGVDLVPRRQLQRGILLKALTEQELRDIQSGKRVTGQAAKRHAILVRGAMLEDTAVAFRRAAYGAAHERGVALQEAAIAAGIAIRLGDHIAVHLDDKPVAPPRVTQFISSGAEPNQEIPPGQGQRQLSPAEEGFEEVREDEVR